MFVLSTALLLLVGCSAYYSAPVVERSREPVNRPKTHVVIPGDTLFSIAWRYGLKYEKLAQYNGIRPPYLIRPSQVIRLDLPDLGVNKAPQPVKKTTGFFRRNESKTEVSSHQQQNASKIKHTKVQHKKQDAFPLSGAPQWRWPVSGPVLSSFQSNSGLNKGIDIGGKLGEPVLAAASGKVVYSGAGLRGYGKLLIIKHNETFLSAYAHNNILRVNEGDFVKVGQIIAEMGSSGTDRVKLHFEIRRDGVPVDPMRFLPRR